MKKSGAQAVRKVLGQYVHQLKSGVLPRLQQEQPISNHTEGPSGNPSDL